MPWEDELLLGGEEELLLGELEELLSLLEELLPRVDELSSEELEELPRVELPCIPASCWSCWIIC